jgi:ATP-dependent helicase/nuclease subunit B
MHYLLETLFGEVGHEALAAMDEDTLRKRVQDAILRYLEESMGGVEDKSQRFLFLFRRLAESAMVVISHIARELMQSEFRPIGYEMTLHKGGDFPPLTLSLSDGGTVCVNGVIDRVDVYEEGGKRFVRIIDYKTGSKEFRLSDVLSGMNMQMLIYLASLLETKQFQPAGILYMPSTRPMVSAGVGTSVEKINAAVDKKLRMNGLLLEDPSLVIAMEQTGAGRYVPATVKDGAVRSTASTVTTLQMEQVLSHVRYLVQEMGQQLHRGAVGDVPIKGVYDGCAYCPYFAVCGHEEDTGNLCSRFSKQEVLRQMEEREQEGDHHESMDNGTTKRH